MNSRDIFAAKRSAVTELRSIYDAAEGRELSAEERQAEARLSDAIQRLDRQAENVAADAEARSAFAASPVQSILTASGKVVADSPEARSFMADVSDRRPARLELRDDVALVKGTATDGAEVVTDTLYGSAIEFLRESDDVLGELNIVRGDNGSDLIVPSVTSYSADASIVAENGTIGRDAPQFDTVTIPVYKYANLIQFSRELLADNGVSGFREMVVRQGVEALGRGFAAHVISGTGTAQPQGLDTASVNTVTAAGTAAWTADELIEIQHSIASPYRRNAVWVLNDAAIEALRKLKDGDGNYLWAPGLNASAPDTFLGKRVINSASIAAPATGVASVVFGDLNRAGIARMVGGFAVDTSEDFAFDTDLVTVRFVARMGFGLVDEKALVVGSNA
jgi:HK97 family phage major capsid protein